jgi:type I site-specific restriction-modification system R (restriction) subunit
MELLWDFEERQGIMTNEKKKKQKERFDWLGNKKEIFRERSTDITWRTFCEPSSIFNLIFFFIYVGVRASLRAPRLISQSTKHHVNLIDM